MKRTVALLLGAIVVAGAAMVVWPPLTASPVYSIPQLQAGLTPRHNVWGGRTVWVRAVAVLGYDVGHERNTVVLAEHAPIGNSPGLLVLVKPPNLTFTLLTWEASVARHVPGVGWLYGQHAGVYRVRFFKPTWCFSCPAGQLR